MRRTRDTDTVQANTLDAQANTLDALHRLTRPSRGSPPSPRRSRSCGPPSRWSRGPTLVSPPAPAPVQRLRQPPQPIPTVPFHLFSKTAKTILQRKILETDLTIGQYHELTELTMIGRRTVPGRQRPSRPDGRATLYPVPRAATGLGRQPAQEGPALDRSRVSEASESTQQSGPSAHPDHAAVKQTRPEMQQWNNPRHSPVRPPACLRPPPPSEWLAPSAFRPDSSRGSLPWPGHQAAPRRRTARYKRRSGR